MQKLPPRWWRQPEDVFQARLAALDAAARMFAVPQRAVDAVVVLRNAEAYEAWLLREVPR
jgi:hypothetical protein